MTRPPRPRWRVPPPALVAAAALLACGCATGAPVEDPEGVREPGRFLMSLSGGPGWFRGDVAEDGLRGGGSADAAAWGIDLEARLGRLSVFGGFLGLLIADDLGYSAPSISGETLDVDHNISVFSVGAGWRLAHSRAERTEIRERSVYDGVSKTMVPVAPETLPVELWRLDILAGGRAIEERARASEDAGGSTVDVASEGIGWGEGFAGLRLEVRPVEGWFFRVGGDAGVVSPADGTTLHGSFVTGIDLGSRVNLVVRAEIWEFDFQEGANSREEFSGRATAVTLGFEYWW